jgi:hypothetical protein
MISGLATTACISTARSDPQPKATPDPMAVLEDQEVPVSALDFLGWNRWHGRAYGRNVTVHAGVAGSRHPGTGMVLVDWQSTASSGPQVQILRLRHSGPLMIVSGRQRRLVLHDSHGYRHNLDLGLPRSSLSGPVGRRVVVPAESPFPAAGVCGRYRGRVVTVAAAPDVPVPRCARVRPDQDLRVVNRTSQYGQPARPVVVRFAGRQPTTLQVGESVTYRKPFGNYLAPGVHSVHMSVFAGGGAEIWLR